MHPDYNKDVLKCDLNVESVGWFVILYLTMNSMKIQYLERKSEEMHLY